MKKIIIYLLLLAPTVSFAQSKDDNDSTPATYKKRVLETTEIDILASFYTQDGSNAAVTGGIGTEKLDDVATTISVSIPLNDDDILSIDGTISAYSSASSSNLNPFGGASSEEDDDDDRAVSSASIPETGTPWEASSGASKSDVWVNGIVGYSHSSDDRNNIVSANLSFATEYDYSSFGVGAGYARLFNQKNTEVSISTNVFLDTWNPQYPTEIKTYIEEDGNLNGGFFNGVNILDSYGVPIDKNGTVVWQPINNTLITDRGRNTFSFLLSFSQIITKRQQIAIFSDIVIQQGWLANPMQRVYFADRDNYYIGVGTSIPVYETPENKDVFQLADDIERLPDKRFKIPIGARLNLYVTDFLTVRTYYRYYFDDWGINSHTVNIELLVKIGSKFTFYPTFRYYDQTATDYFAPFEQHLSTEKYYTSDYDLSKFSSKQYGFGIQYSDLLSGGHTGTVVLKNLTLNYGYYDRSTGLNAHIVSFGVKLALN